MKVAEYLSLGHRADVTRLAGDILRLNEHLRAMGDPARARYVEVTPGWDPGWYGLFRLTLEMPPPDDPDHPNCWSHETHTRYRELLYDYFDSHGICVGHYFRTAEQLAESPPLRGVPVPEYADQV